jgi:hypothetical protein
MVDVVLYPRLPRKAARERLLEVTQASMEKLGALASVSHRDAVFPATGGRRITEEVLLSIRESVVSCARDCGFPSASSKEMAASFDLQASSALASIPMCAGEGARDEVWSFMALVLLPDVACWRFPDRNERRLLGGVRNVFQRLWLRGQILAEPDLIGLPEDALVGLMERPAISSNPVVARAIAKSVLRIARTIHGSVREDVWREAYKRIRQRAALVNFDALSDRELESQIRELEYKAIEKFRQAGAPAPAVEAVTEESD